jgi:hypothetical protein
VRAVGAVLLTLGLVPKLAVVGQEPQQLSAPGVSPAVWSVFAVPRGPGPHPGVILLPGSNGWQPT